MSEKLAAVKAHGLTVTTDMADEIFVINVNGYIWESARSEIEYATAHEKHVNYLEQILIYQLTMDLEEENV